jgi:hypothetical protein
MFCRLNKRTVTHMRQLVAVFSPRKPGFHTGTLLRDVYAYLPAFSGPYSFIVGGRVKGTVRVGGSTETTSHRTAIRKNKGARNRFF